MNDLIDCYKRLALVIVASAVNEYAAWLAQQELYPRGMEDIRIEASQTGKRASSLYSNYLKAQEQGNRAYKFLTDEAYIGNFTTYTSDELISFAKRKAKFLADDHRAGKKTILKTWIDWWNNNEKDET